MASEQGPKLVAKPHDPTKPFRQHDVDQVRIPVLNTRLVQAVVSGIVKPPIAHLRFPAPRLAMYLLRDYGLTQKVNFNPPPDSEREPWERGLRLEIDVGPIPPSVRKAVLQVLRERKRYDHKHSAAQEDRVKEILAHELKDRRIWSPGEAGKLWTPR
jgi:hypothetical protein